MQRSERGHHRHEEEKSSKVHEGYGFGMVKPKGEVLPEKYQKDFVLKQQEGNIPEQLDAGEESDEEISRLRRHKEYEDTMK